MAFGNNPRENFSCRPNTLLEDQMKPYLGKQIKIHRQNGFSMGESSSTLHFHHGFQQPIGNNQFLTTENSSKNPFSGVRNQQLNLFEPLRYNSSADIGCYNTVGAAPVTVGGASGVVDRVESGSVLDCPQEHRPMVFQESGLGNTSLMEGSPYIADQKNRKKVQERKAGKLKEQWTPQEDSLLIKMVENYGEKRWSKIAKHLSGKVGKQCRERWQNHLRPNVKKDPWTEEEDRILIQAHREKGNKWTEISRRLPGRTENTVKNHWNATKRRYLSSKSCKSPKSGLLQDYMKQIFSVPETPHFQPNNAYSEANLPASQQVPQQWQSQQLVPSSMDASLYRKTMWESSGLMKSTSCQSYNAASGPLINEIPDGSVIGEGNLLDDEIPIDMNALMQFEANKGKGLLETIGNFNP